MFLLNSISLDSTSIIILIKDYESLLRCQSITAHVAATL